MSIFTRARRDRNEVGVRHGDIALAVGVVPPCHDRSVGLEPQAVVAAPRDLHEVGVRRGDIALAAAIAPPGHDSPVGREA